MSDMVCALGPVACGFDEENGDPIHCMAGQACFHSYVGHSLCQNVARDQCSKRCADGEVLSPLRYCTCISEADRDKMFCASPPPGRSGMGSYGGDGCHGMYEDSESDGCCEMDGYTMSMDSERDGESEGDGTSQSDGERYPGRDGGNGRNGYPGRDGGNGRNGCCGRRMSYGRRDPNCRGQGHPLR